MTKIIFDQQTKDGFGGIIPAGVRCRVIKEKGGNVWIETINGTHFWGNAEDLEPVPIRETKLCKPKKVHCVSGTNESILLVAKSWKLNPANGIHIYNTISNIINHSVRWN